MSKSKMLRLTSLVLALIMAFSLMAGCGKQNEGTPTTAGATTAGTTASGAAANTSEPKNSWEIDTSPVTLSIYLYWFPSDIGSYWETSTLTKKMIEETGVRLEVNYNEAGDSSKLNTLIASGDLPDLLFIQSGTPEAMSLVQNDMVWALNELSDKYAPDFMERVPKNVLTHTRFIYESMNFYHATFQFINETMLVNPWIPKNWMSGLTVEKGIYEAIGKPEIKTGDDYLNMLRTVKQKYPDIIPVQSVRYAPGTGVVRIIEALKPYVALTPYYKDGDTWKSQYESPHYLQLLQFANTLFNEKLADKAELTATAPQKVANLNNGMVFSEIEQDADNLDGINIQASKVKPGWNFMMIDPFAIDPQIKPAWPAKNGVGYAGLMVSKNSKHPDRAIRFINYLYDEKTQMNMQFGVEGVHYDMVDGVPVLRQQWRDAINQDVQKVMNEEGIQLLGILRNEHWYQLLNLQLATTSTLEDAMKISNNYADPDMWKFNSGDKYIPETEESKIYSVISDYVTGAIMKILIAKPSDVEMMYNQMLDQLKKLGLDKLTAFNGKYIDDMSSELDKYSK